jgi:hypothetical protein
MKHKRLARLICMACVLSCASLFAYHAVAAPKRSAGTCSEPVSVVHQARPAPQVLLRGERLFTFAGYELDVSFTPGGEVVSFELRARRAREVEERADVRP